MAIEIIGEDPTAFKKVTCKNCASILQYLPMDLKFGNTDVGYYCYIVCPKCTVKITIKDE